MLTEAADYDTLYRNFRWDIPARFNIAGACCDRHADGQSRTALIYVDEDGGAQRTSFDEMRAMSCAFANVLKADGLSRRNSTGEIPARPRRTARTAGSTPGQSEMPPDARPAVPATATETARRDRRERDHRP